ncbi:MAG: HTH domain-containing protein [Clostridiales bacterium]|jgi:Mn-dependent DtxR family transcriptional regulator|nr:HTH domain-containing protein [Clostridiales bacterium]
MDKKLFITAAEMAECLGVSKSHAYKIIKKLNDQLKSDGYMTVTGKVSRKYFVEKFYGVTG